MGIGGVWPWAALLLAGLALCVAVAVWRRMLGSARLPVRVAADLVFSLMLGAVLVAALVWAADRTDLRPAQVAALRRYLQTVGDWADVPAWIWVLVYLLLAVLGGLALWRPQRLERVAERLKKAHVVPAVEVSRRVLTDVHIGLLAVALLGLSAPPAVASRLQPKIRNHAVIAYQQDLDSRLELVAYQQLQHQLATPSNHYPPGDVAPLRDLVEKVHAQGRSGSANGGGDQANDGERDLARRLGQAQGDAVLYASDVTGESAETAAKDLTAPVVDPAVAAAQAEASGAGLDGPITDAGDGDRRLGELQKSRKESEERAKEVKEVADLCASTLASVLQVPSATVGPREVVDILKEYLSGLVEGSPRLRKLFQQWTDRVTRPSTSESPGASDDSGGPAETGGEPAAPKGGSPLTPEIAAAVVVPVPFHLEIMAATRAFHDELAAAEKGIQLQDTSVPKAKEGIDAAIQWVQRAAAVDQDPEIHCSTCVAPERVEDRPRVDQHEFEHGVPHFEGRP